MRNGFGLGVMATIFLLANSAWSQSQAPTQDDTASTTDTQVQQGPKPAFTYPDTTPSLDFVSQAAENSALTLGISGGIGYFGNVGSDTNSSNQNRVLLQVRPSIK